jgi:hypothetical protein
MRRVFANARSLDRFAPLATARAVFRLEKKRPPVLLGGSNYFRTIIYEKVAGWKQL